MYERGLHGSATITRSVVSEPPQFQPYQNRRRRANRNRINHNSENALSVVQLDALKKMSRNTSDRQFGCVDQFKERAGHTTSE